MQPKDLGPGEGGKQGGGGGQVAFNSDMAGFGPCPGQEPLGPAPFSQLPIFCSLPSPQHLSQSLS